MIESYINKTFSTKEDRVLVPTDFGSISSLLSNIVKPIVSSSISFLSENIELNESIFYDIYINKINYCMLPLKYIDYFPDNLSFVDFSFINTIYLTGEIISKDDIKKLRNKIPTLKDNSIIIIYGSTEAKGTISYISENDLEEIYVMEDQNKIYISRDCNNVYEYLNNQLISTEIKFNNSFNKIISCCNINNNMKLNSKERTIEFNDGIKWINTGDVGIFLDNKVYIVSRKTDYINGISIKNIEDSINKEIFNQVIIFPFKSKYNICITYIKDDKNKNNFLKLWEDTKIVRELVEKKYSGTFNEIYVINKDQIKYKGLKKLIRKRLNEIINENNNIKNEKFYKNYSLYTYLKIKKILNKKNIDNEILQLSHNEFFIRNIKSKLFAKSDEYEVIDYHNGVLITLDDYFLFNHIFKKKEKINDKLIKSFTHDILIQNKDDSLCDMLYSQNWIKRKFYNKANINIIKEKYGKFIENDIPLIDFHYLSSNCLSYISYSIKGENYDVSDFYNNGNNTLFDNIISQLDYNENNKYIFIRFDGIIYNNASKEYFLNKYYDFAKMIKSFIKYIKVNNIKVICNNNVKNILINYFDYENKFIETDFDNLTLKIKEEKNNNFFNKENIINHLGDIYEFISFGNFLVSNNEYYFSIKLNNQEFNYKYDFKQKITDFFDNVQSDLETKFINNDIFNFIYDIKNILIFIKKYFNNGILENIISKLNKKDYLSLTNKEFSILDSILKIYKYNKEMNCIIKDSNVNLSYYYSYIKNNNKLIRYDTYNQFQIIYKDFYDKNNNEKSKNELSKLNLSICGIDNSSLYIKNKKIEYNLDNDNYLILNLENVGKYNLYYKNNKDNKILFNDISSLFNILRKRDVKYIFIENGYIEDYKFTGVLKVIEEGSKYENDIHIINEIKKEGYNVIIDRQYIKELFVGYLYNCENYKWNYNEFNLEKVQEDFIKNSFKHINKNSEFYEVNYMKLPINEKQIINNIIGKISNPCNKYAKNKEDDIFEIYLQEMTDRISNGLPLKKMPLFDLDEIKETIKRHLNNEEYFGYICEILDLTKDRYLLNNDEYFMISNVLEYYNNLKQLENNTNQKIR